jgi:hypothetical protein
LKAALLQFGILAALFWTLCSLDTAPRPARSALAPAHGADQWRRTAHGWEQRSDWVMESPARPAQHPVNFAAVHPLNIAVLQVLISVGALMLLPPKSVAAPSVTN